MIYLGEEKNGGKIEGHPKNTTCNGSLSWESTQYSSNLKASSVVGNEKRNKVREQCFMCSNLATFYRNSNYENLR